MRVKTNEHGVQYCYQEFTAWRELFRLIPKNNSWTAEATSERNGKVYHVNYYNILIKSQSVLTRGGFF